MTWRTASRTNMSSYKLGVGVMMLASQVAVLGAPREASAFTTTVEPIPTVVVGPTTSEYPLPPCSKCKVVAKRETNANNQARGLLFIGYEDEVFEDFEGDIEVTILLSNDTRYVETIPDVQLSQNEEMTWVLPDPVQLSWLDVEIVWVELVPAT